MEIANTILQQIQGMDRWALMAWGAKNFVGGKLDGKHEGLKFQVNGLKFKGWVMVLYNYGMDTYTVKTYKLVKGDVKYYHEQEDVHFPELVEVIDGFIEKN